MSINPDDVLALLEDGPKAQSDLVVWLSRMDLADDVNERLVRDGLQRLKREGQIKRIGTVGKWALASYLAPNGRPPLPPGAARVRKRLCRQCLQKQTQHGDLCQRCWKASATDTPGLVDVARRRLAARVDVPSRPTIATRVEGATLIRIIDGVEYEVFDLDELGRRKAAERNDPT